MFTFPITMFDSNTDPNGYNFPSYPTPVQYNAEGGPQIPIPDVQYLNNNWKLVGNKCVSWNDYKNQNTVSNTDNLSPSVVTDSNFGGKPSVSFTNSATYLVQDDGSKTIAPVDVFLVGKFNDVSVTNTFTAQPGNNPIIPSLRSLVGGETAQNRFRFFAGGSQVFTPSNSWDNSPHIFYHNMVAGTPGSVVLSVDTASTPVSTNVTGWTSSPTYPFQLSSAAGYQLNGQIAELLIYESALTQQQKDNILGYLSSKFGITVS